MDLKHTIASTGLKNGENVIYTRRMYGTERLAATVAQHVDGCGHIFVGCLTTFKSAQISSSQLISYARNAWVRTRFDAPWVAHRSFTGGTEPNSWIHAYDTSSSNGFGAAESWATKTIFWRDELHSLAEWEDILLGAYWKPNDGRFGMEWHLARAPNQGYLIMTSIAHWLGDGRGLLPVIDLFFNHLLAEINGSVLVPAKNLRWGEEIPRLCSASVLAVEHNTETFQNVQTEPTAPKRFTRPLTETTNWESVPSRMANIKLSRKETSALHSICRFRKVTITSLLNSLCIIADIQTTLRLALSVEARDAIRKDFEVAEVYVVQNNIADRRYLLSKQLPSVAGPGRFGNLIMQILPSVHSMDDIRKIVHFSSNGSTVVDTDCDAFWSGLVAGSDLSQKANKECTPEAFVASEQARDAFAPAFDKSMYLTPGIGSTSIGKLSTLGLLTKFRPSVARADPHSPFVLDQLAMGFRATSPDCLHITAIMWEYDSEITIHLMASPRWHDSSAWNLYEESARSLLRQILKVTPRL